MRQHVEEYKKEIAYLLTVYPRRKVKRMLYDDHERHQELDIGETTCDKIWLSLMTRTNPTDETYKSKKVTVYYAKSRRFAGAFPNVQSCARKLGVGKAEVKHYLRTRKPHSIYLFKEETR